MLYRQVLAGDRNHFGSLHHLGIIALQRGQPQAAIEPIGRAIAIDGRNPECRFNIAFAFQSLGRLNEAVNHYREAIRLKPDYIDAYTNLGNALLQTGALTEAIATYERLIALRPTAEAHCNLANVLARSGRLDDAVTQFRRALALKPDLVAAHNNLANALAGLGRPDEALGHFQKALALDPNLVEAHVNVGNVLLAQGKQAEAVAQFQRALAVNPNFPDAHASLGNVFLAQGRLSDAAQCYQRALDLKPDLPEANNNLGIVLSAQGNFAEAARRFQLAIARKPDFVDAYNNLARVFLSTGQMDNALGALRRALAIRETADTQALFVQTVRGLQVPPDVDDFRALFWRALSEPWGRVNVLAPVAAKIVKQSAAISACISRAVAAWPRRLPAEELFGPDGLAAVADDRILRSLMETATDRGPRFRTVSDQRALCHAADRIRRRCVVAGRSEGAGLRLRAGAAVLRQRARLCVDRRGGRCRTAVARQGDRRAGVGRRHPRALARRGRGLLSAGRAARRGRAPGQELVARRSPAC